MPVLTTRGIINLLREVFPHSKFAPDDKDNFTCSFLSRASFRADVYPYRIRVLPLPRGDMDVILSVTMKWEEPTYDSVGIETWTCKDTLEDATDLDEILGWVSWIRTLAVLKKDDVGFHEGHPAWKMPFTAKLLWSTYARDDWKTPKGSSNIWWDPPWMLKTLIGSKVAVVRNPQPGNLTQPMMFLEAPWEKPDYAVIVADLETSAHTILIQRGIHNPARDPGPIDPNGVPLWEGQSVPLDMDKFKEILTGIQAKRTQTKPHPSRLIISPKLHSELQKQIPTDMWLEGAPLRTLPSYGIHPPAPLPIQVEPLMKSHEFLVVYDDGSTQKHRI